MLHNVNFYGIILCLNFTISIFYIIKKSQKMHFLSQDIFYMIFYIVLGIIIGGKYYTILTHYSTYKDANFLSVGMSSLGSLIGSVIMISIYIFQFQKEAKTVFNIFIPVLPLMYGIGKIGCFLSGCCVGIQYSGPFSVSYHHVSYFPIQLIESITFIIIFIFIDYLSKKEDKNIIAKCFILCGGFKFLLEFLRLRDTVFLNVNQIVCICLIFLGIIVIKENKFVGKS